MAWFEDFLAQAQDMNLQEVFEVGQELVNVEGEKEIDPEVLDRISSEIKRIKIGGQDAHQLLREFSLNENETPTSFVQEKLNRKLRLLRNRSERSISDGFGSYVVYLRKKQGMSLKTLEELTGISASYINRIEKGERKAPTYPIIEKLASALNVEVSELLTMAGMGIPTQSAQGFAQVVYSQPITFNGRLATKEQKELVVGIVEHILSAKWDGRSKNKEMMAILDLIDEFKDSL